MRQTDSSRRSWWDRLPPTYLIAGYLAIGIFMTGDGFEQAFLSHYIVSIGFTPSNASLVFTLYGVCAGLSAWSAGVLAEMFGPRRVMLAGALIWLVFHSLFLQLGLKAHNYPLILAFYCFRAIGYPLFIYAFFVWLTRTIAPNRLASAMGWFWTMFMFGIGFMGSYVPSFTIPMVGEMQTLWLAMVVVALGAAVGYFALRLNPDAGPGEASKASSKWHQLSRGILLAVENKSIFYACLVMALCPMAIFGFAVIMPFLFVDQLGFTSSEWLRVWGAMLLANMVMNTLSGTLGDRIGWMKLIRFQACVGVAITSLLFYYVPSHLGHNLWIATAVAMLHGACLTGFTPLAAVFPALAPKEKGAAISLYNLSVGLGSCVGPGIATFLLPVTGVVGVVWTYSALYLVAGLLTYKIHLKSRDGDESKVDRSSAYVAE